MNGVSWPPVDDADDATDGEEDKITEIGNSNNDGDPHGNNNKNNQDDNTLMNHTMDTHLETAHARPVRQRRHHVWPSKYMGGVQQWMISEEIAAHPIKNRRSEKRKRPNHHFLCIDEPQQQQLTNAFEKDAHPSAAKMSKIAEDVGLQADTVNRWFQDRQSLSSDRIANDNNENSATPTSITPPSGLHRPYPCSGCGKNYVSPQGVRIHQKNHPSCLPANRPSSEQRTSATSFSSSSSSSTSNGARTRDPSSKSSDDAKRIHMCPKCGKRYSQKSGVRHHQKNYPKCEPPPGQRAPTKAMIARNDALVRRKKDARRETKNLARRHEGAHAKQQSTVTRREGEIKDKRGAKKAKLTRRRRGEEENGKRELKKYTIDEKMYKCEKCDRRYAYPSGVSHHQRIHPNCENEPLDTPYEPTVNVSSTAPPPPAEPATATVTVGATTAHTSAAMNLKPFHCERCNREYSSRPGLLIHQRTHPNCVRKEVVRTSRSIECDLCGKLFEQRAALSIHQLGKVDTSIRTCHICGKTILCPHALKNHCTIHKHQLPWPLTCRVCPKRFAHPEQQIYHYDQHRSDGTF